MINWGYKISFSHKEMILDEVRFHFQHSKSQRLLNVPQSLALKTVNFAQIVYLYILYVFPANSHFSPM